MPIWGVYGADICVNLQQSVKFTQKVITKICPTSAPWNSYECDGRLASFWRLFGQKVTTKRPTVSVINISHQPFCSQMSVHFGTTKRPDRYMILLLNPIRWSNILSSESYDFGDTSPVLVGLLLAKKWPEKGQILRRYPQQRMLVFKKNCSVRVTKICVTD